MERDGYYVRQDAGGGFRGTGSAKRIVGSALLPGSRFPRYISVKQRGKYVVEAGKNRTDEHKNVSKTAKKYKTFKQI